MFPCSAASRYHSTASPYGIDRGRRTLSRGSGPAGAASRERVQGLAFGSDPNRLAHKTNDACYTAPRFGGRRLASEFGERVVASVSGEIGGHHVRRVPSPLRERGAKPETRDPQLTQRARKLRLQQQADFQRRATIALAPRTLQNIPERFSRDAITVRRPASITPEPTNRPCRRNSRYLIRSALRWK